MEISGFSAMDRDPNRPVPQGARALRCLAMADLEGFRERCDLLAEELADAALELLRQAVGGDDEAARTEKRVTRARRAVEKASGLLSGSERLA